MSGVTDSGDNYIFSLPMVRLSPTPREWKLMYLILNRGYAMQCDLDIFELTIYLVSIWVKKGSSKASLWPMTRWPPATIGSFDIEKTRREIIQHNTKCTTWASSEMSRSMRGPSPSDIRVCWAIQGKFQIRNSMIDSCLDMVSIYVRDAEQLQSFSFSSNWGH
jgi:hypothetical protein